MFIWVGGNKCYVGYQALEELDFRKVTSYHVPHEKRQSIIETITLTFGLEPRPTGMYILPIMNRD